jgi:CDP-archaeol synthase
MHYSLLLQLLILLMVANGAPVLAKLLFGNRLSRPIDGNLELPDGQPLLGPSKTIRGFLISALATTVAAPLLGFESGIGLLVGVTAMAGDLASSFLKRRLKLQPSSKATGIDQVPEALFPMLACWQPLSLTITDIVAATALFMAGEMLLSRILFRLHVRDRPY